MEIIYIIAAIQALFFAVSLPLRGKNHKHVIWFMIALLSIAIYMGFNYLEYIIESDFDFSLIAALSLHITGPALFFHTMFLISYNDRKNKSFHFFLTTREN